MLCPICNCPMDNVSNAWHCSVRASDHFYYVSRNRSYVSIHYYLNETTYWIVLLTNFHVHSHPPIYRNDLQAEKQTKGKTVARTSCERSEYDTFDPRDPRWVMRRLDLIEMMQ